MDSIVKFHNCSFFLFSISKAMIISVSHLTIQVLHKHKNEIYLKRYSALTLIYNLSIAYNFKVTRVYLLFFFEIYYLTPFNELELVYFFHIFFLGSYWGPHGKMKSLLDRNFQLINPVWVCRQTVLEWEMVRENPDLLKYSQWDRISNFEVERIFSTYRNMTSLMQQQYYLCKLMYLNILK